MIRQETPGDDIRATIHGDVSGQVAVGKQITQRQTIGAASAELTQADLVELRQALKDMHAALGQAHLPDDTLIGAQTAVGNALVQGIKNGEAKPGVILSHVQEVAETLKQANVTVREGSSLWQSVQRLAPLLGPLVVGGAHAIAAWFGIFL